jgi:hypothetical protein
MVFTVEFKQKVFDTLQFNPYLLQCMEALERNNPNLFRIYMDMAIDEVQKAMEPRLLLDDGDRMIWNGIVTQYKALNALNAEFLDTYIHELDGKNTRVNG